MEYSEHLPWKSRGYLPHVDVVGELQSITFRLADSMPQGKLAQLKKELDVLDLSIREVEKRKRVEYWLDQGMGSCLLQHPKVAQVVQDTFLKFDGERYKLVAWCIMPNHVHILIKPSVPVSKIVQSWKSYTGRWIKDQNTTLQLGMASNSVWMPDYWDRFIRSHEHLNNVIAYIHQNPVKAGLCKDSSDWQWSSAYTG